MTYREFIRSALPPAPEPPALGRFRHLTAGGCLLAASLLGTARALDNQPAVLAVLAFLVGIAAFVALVALIRRKVRHDLDYWTPERVRLHRAFPDMPLSDGPVAGA